MSNAIGTRRRLHSHVDSQTKRGHNGIPTRWVCFVSIVPASLFVKAQAASGALDWVVMSMAPHFLQFDKPH
jgi:hypothetical protein